jgi:hypothetical protein
VGAVGILLTDSGAATMEPYRRMAKTSRPRPARTSVLAVRPSWVFPGLWAGIVRRDPVGFAVSFAGVLAKFMPLFLSNVPFRLTLTYSTHLVCAWTAVAILGVMIAVLLACMVFVSWPSLPVDPETIAGTLYYIVHSYFLGSEKDYGDEGEILQADSPETDSGVVDHEGPTPNSGKVGQEGPGPDSVVVGHGSPPSSSAVDGQTNEKRQRERYILDDIVEETDRRYFLGKVLAGESEFRVAICTVEDT